MGAKGVGGGVVSKGKRLSSDIKLIVHFFAMFAAGCGSVDGRPLQLHRRTVTKLPLDS
jgi:hypothetical protein